MPDLPNWVYDLLIDLDEQRKLHPKLFFTSGAFEGYAQYDWCPCNALARVPDAALSEARVIRRYRDAAGLPEESTDG